MRISDWSSDVCSSDLRYLPSAFCDGVRPTASTGSFAGACGSGSWLRKNAHPQISRPIPASMMITKASDHMIFSAVGWLRSEEHTSELQSLMRISYAVFCLKKKNTTKQTHTTNKKIKSQ